MKVIPLNDRVLVRVKESNERTPSGLYIPKTAQEQVQEGKILVSNVDTLHEGTDIIFDKYAGTALIVDGVTCLLLKNTDILAEVQNG